MRAICERCAKHISPLISVGAGKLVYLCNDCFRKWVNIWKQKIVQYSNEPELYEEKWNEEWKKFMIKSKEVVLFT